MDALLKRTEPLEHQGLDFTLVLYRADRGSGRSEIGWHAQHGAAGGGAAGAAAVGPAEIASGVPENQW